MTTPIEISKTNILKEVMQAVQSAEKEILATMDLAEEIKRPLPKKYFRLLVEKINDGVAIKRLAFGTQKDFATFNKEHVVKSPKYTMHLAKIRTYKRMLLVDRKRLFFAKGKADNRKFFFTSDPSRIKEFRLYFKEGFSYIPQ